MNARTLLSWMRTHGHTIDYVARQCGIDEYHLLEMLCDETSATGEDLEALARVIDVPVETLRRVPDAEPAMARLDPLRSYDIKQVADFLDVGRDRIEHLLDTGELGHIRWGVRTIRIPGFAIEETLRASMRYGRVEDESCAPHHTVGHSPPPTRVPPERDEDDTLPPPGRLL